MPFGQSEHQGFPAAPFHKVLFPLRFVGKSDQLIDPVFQAGQGELFLSV